MEIFSERLRELRKSAGLTQKELASILLTNNSSICDWERGRNQPDLETIVVIARFFEVRVDYLLGLED
ncbi:MAG: helix-turn-helix transcriptional regulator [Clostridia bacterium]|nr:helix-turn-helix transcriptional regulator [Clostridia bacterium]